MVLSMTEASVLLAMAYAVCEPLSGSDFEAIATPYKKHPQASLYFEYIFVLHAAWIVSTSSGVDVIVINVFYKCRKCSSLPADYVQ